jgi:iron complex outermembrane receptor protein
VDKKSYPAACFFLICTILFFATATPGQTPRGLVSGKVTDANRLPLAQVSIVVVGTDIATITDEKGIYLLRVPFGSQKISARLIGYDHAQFPVVVGNSKVSSISFTLKENPLVMKDVVVSGVKAKSATATRTLLEIQDIPQSIVVLGQKLIREQAAYDLTTIVRNMSGINFSGNYSGAGSAQFFNARGFDLNDAQNYRWNGMMIWNWGNNYADNIEQVEFLKGPNSILFGDVSPGGIMNFVTKKPLAEFALNANFKTGSWGLLRPSLDITGPLNKSRSLRFRVNTSYEKSNSFRDYVHSSRKFVAPSISWDITPRLSLNVETVFKSSTATDDAGLVSPNGNIDGLKTLDPSLYLGEPSLEYLFKDQSYFLTLNAELSKTWRLKATGFYGKTVNRPSGLWFDQPDKNGDFARRIYGFNQKAHNVTGSVSAYGTFYTGPVKHNTLFGLDFQSTRYRYTNGGELSLLDTNNIFAPKHGTIRLEQPAASPLRPYVSIIARTGVNFQDQFMFLDEKLQVLIGLRAAITKQGNHYFQNLLIGTPYEGYRDDLITKQNLTPKVGIVYKPRSWYSLYSSYSKGFEINSPDVFAQNYTEYATPPATISSQIELGSKFSVFSNRLGITVSAFTINKHHPYGYVYLNPEKPNYDEYNVYYQGHHRSRGIEFDADGKLFPTLSVTAGAAFMQTRVISDPGYPTGNRLANAPKATANIWLHYQPATRFKGFSVGSGLYYKSGFFSSLQNDPNLEIPAGYTWDIALGYQHKSIGLQLNAMNVTNQVSYLNPWQFNLFDVKPLRQLVLSLNYKFASSPTR